MCNKSYRAGTGQNVSSKNCKAIVEKNNPAGHQGPNARLYSEENE